MFCDFCPKTFTSLKGLNIHHTRIHCSSESKLPTSPSFRNSLTPPKSLVQQKVKHTQTPSSNRFGFSCNLCDKQYNNKTDLLKHLKIVHHHSQLEQTINFDSVQEMLIYRQLLTRTETSTFKKITGDKNSGSSLVSYFRCTHSDEENECISFVKSIQFKNNRSRIIFCAFHNHATMFDKVKVPNKTKQMLIKKIRKKIDIKTIYRDLTENVGDNILGKTDMITLDYLRYLRYRYADPKRFGIKDIVSLKKNIELINQKSNKNKTKIKNFTLLQVPTKDESKKKHNKKPFIFSFSAPSFDVSKIDKDITILGDATYGTNLYGFSLIVFGYLNRSQSFCPILYIVTDSETENTCSYVLSKYRDSLDREISAAYFMSDMSPIFHKSWCKIFVKSPKWIYCLWYVKKAVRKQISSKIQNKDLKFKIEQRFEQLTKINTKEEFDRKLGLFERFCNRNNKDFADYFKKQYSKVSERWNLVGRIDSLVNTNMFLEAYFGELKRNYLCYKSRNRLDSLYNSLLMFEQHKRVSELRQEVSNQLQYKGYRCRIAHKKHRLSELLNLSLFKYDDQFKLYQYKKHVIQMGSCSNCNINCLFFCYQCKICPYRYVCSCISFSSRKEYCKHVHAVHKIERNREANNEILKHTEVICRNTEAGEQVEVHNDVQLPGGNVEQTEEIDTIPNCHFQDLEEMQKDVGKASEPFKQFQALNAKSECTLRNEENINKVKSGIIKDIKELSNLIIECTDLLELKRVKEEIELLKNFISCHGSEYTEEEMEIDNGMLKKQKTQRSYFK